MGLRFDSAGPLLFFEGFLNLFSSFAQFDLRPAVVRKLASLGFEAPTPVQEQTIPLVLEGRDALVQAKTGSGKTFAFGVPIVSLLEPQHKPQALVVVPTRELATQVSTAIASVCPKSGLRILPIFGGVSLERQERALRDGIDIVVGTPGRLKDLMGRRSLDLSRVTILVLDEADEMLDMGFRRDIEYLVDRLPARRQTLVLSATMPESIRTIAQKYLHDPTIVAFREETATPSEISHYFVRVSVAQRFDALVALIEAEAPERALIFTAMKHETRRIALKLDRATGMEAGFLNGNMSQNARDRTLDRFRAGELRFLIATDVAARGLDIEGLTHVFHYSVPTVVEKYVHRSGRTGRAGNTGKTFCLVTPDGEESFGAIRKRVRSSEIRLDPATLPVADPNAPPTEERRAGRSGGRSGSPSQGRSAYPQGRERYDDGPSRERYEGAPARERPAAAPSRERSAATTTRDRAESPARDRSDTSSRGSAGSSGSSGSSRNYGGQTDTPAPRRGTEAGPKANRPWHRPRKGAPKTAGRQ